MESQAFNTVNQQDSQIIKSDSKCMKGIAMMTMFFLPAATVGVSKPPLLMHEQHLLSQRRVYAGANSSVSIRTAIRSRSRLISSFSGR